MDEADARQRRQGARRERNTDRGRQRRDAGSHPEDDRRHGGRPRARSRERRAARTQPVPRHHRLPGDRLGGRRVRWVRPAVGHSRRGESQADGCRVRLELLLLALRHVQQRRDQAPLLRRVGRWRAAQVPGDRQTRVGGGRDLHAGRQPDDVPEYYKMTAPQTQFENCVAHNGSLIPIPGRDVMVQAWYQGGISVFEWTDPAHPKEIAFFDRGPVDSTKMADGGSWSAYWYNGVIVSSEIARGLD